MNLIYNNSIYSKILGNSVFFVSFLPRMTNAYAFEAFNGYHLLTPSWYPLMVSMSISGALFSVANCLNCVTLSWIPFFLWVLLSILVLNMWGSALNNENLKGFHSNTEMANYVVGFVLFLLSEVMFFFSFFWSYIFMAINPDVVIGGYWVYFESPFNAFGIPLFNTLLLVISGFFATHCIKQIIIEEIDSSIESLLISILLGGLFLFFQFVEYKSLAFDITTGVFGSLFYILTGFHGSHVILGLFLLTASLLRLMADYIRYDGYIGTEISVIYWHFVDVVWLFLFLIVYIWK